MVESALDRTDEIEIKIRNRSVYQRMLQLIDKNRTIFQNNREYQKYINDLMSKISSPADRIKSLTILLESNFKKLSELTATYIELHQCINRHGCGQVPRDFQEVKDPDFAARAISKVTEVITKISEENNS